MYLRGKKKVPTSRVSLDVCPITARWASVQLQCTQQQIFRRPPCHSTKSVDSSPRRLMPRTYGGECSLVSLSNISDEASIHESYTLLPRWREKPTCPRSVELLEHQSGVVTKTRDGTSDTDIDLWSSLIEVDDELRDRFVRKPRKCCVSGLSS